MNDNINEFELKWKRFETNLYGKLLAKINQQEITLGLANILLKDASASWFSVYNIEGKWLFDYTQKNSDKGSLIISILKNDMRFSSAIKTKNIPDYLKYVVPAAGAVIGGGIAHLCSLKTIAQVASAVLPAVFLLPAMDSYIKNHTNSRKSIIIDSYLSQLDKFKNSIITIIES